MVTPTLIKVWFAHVCQQMQGNVQACVCIGEPNNGPFTVVETTSASLVENESFLKNLQAVINRRKSIMTRVGLDISAVAVNASHSVEKINSKNYLVTCPILIDRDLYGAVSFEFKPEEGTRIKDYINNVEASVKWLEFLSHTQNEGSPNAALALQITARALTQESASAAATSVVTELATRLNCERVSVAFIEGGDLKLFALSHSARYESKQNLIKVIEAAIEESVQHCETLIYPALEQSSYMLQAHSSLAKQQGSAFICTIPLMHNDQVIGGVILERNPTANEFSTEEVELCEQLAALFAPILEYRRSGDRPIIAVVKESLKSQISNLFGDGHYKYKFIVTTCVVLFAVLFLVQWEYRVSANTVIEGTVERVITAPEDGYIKDAAARPGDVVVMNQKLATLDDSDLLLEKLKWSSKQKQTSKEYREALAGRDRSQIGILRAQMEQVKAQLEIANKKLERTIIAAPIGGVVVSGDFTNALGSPVERGQILYTVSPLDQYRVLLDVNEADIAELNVGMVGELTLSAAAEDVFVIVIEKITPVSISGDGSNYFQVEASLLNTPSFLRPGMQGVSKILIGDRQLLWIWTHKMVDWIRLKLWAWW